MAISEEKIELYTKFLSYLWSRKLQRGKYNDLFCGIDIIKRFDYYSFSYGAKVLLQSIEDNKVAPEKLEIITNLFHEFILTERL